MSFAGLWHREASTAAVELELALTDISTVEAHPVRLISANGEVAFGYASSLRDPSLHTLPMRRDPGTMIVGDVRVDNRDELRRSLDAPEDEPDQGLILRAYQRWGADCVQRLLGDFAFALWDAPRGELLLVRDACGVRPLFFAVTSGRIAFASRADALVRIPAISDALDERSVCDYLGEFPEDETRTLFAAVRRLAPGNYLHATSRGEHVREYFNIEAVPPLVLKDDREYADALAEALRRSVARRLSGQKSIGVMLSGGLDSTTVTCLAAEYIRAQGGTSLHSYSAVFPDIPACDEREYQRAVVSSAGTQHHEVQPHPGDGSGDISALTRVFGDPGPMGLHWLAWPITQLAARQGISILLTGIDGDRVVSHGGALFSELASQGRFSRLVRECLSVSDFTPGRKVRVATSQLLQALVPLALLRKWDSVDPRKRRRYESSLGLMKASRLRSDRVLERLGRSAMRARDTREAHIRALKSGDRNGDVELLDRLGSAFGVEFRHPFFDRELMTLCLSFPGEQKRRGGFSRYVLRNAMASFAPEFVRTRTRDTSLDDAYWAWVKSWLPLLVDAQRGWNLTDLADWIDVPKAELRLSALPKTGGWPVDLLWRSVVFARWRENFAERSAFPNPRAVL